MRDAPLLSSAAVAAIDDLELAARLVVEGLRSGEHRSPFHGFTAEFSQHRPYRAGDDLKHLDWKVLARTNRLYTRQFSETTNLSAMLVVDASGSMKFPAGAAASPEDRGGSAGAGGDGAGAARGGAGVGGDGVNGGRGRGGTDAGAPGVVSKFDYARVIAAALAYLIIDRGDAAGLMTMSGGRFVYLPARGGRMHLRALLAQLSRLEPAGDWALDRALTRAAELLKRRGVLLAVSDFYDAGDATWRELRRVARRGHDIAVLQVLTRDEVAFPFAADAEFEDLESGERRHLDAAAVAPAYRAAVAAFLEQCRTTSLRDGHDYALMTTDVAPARALRNYLMRRAAGAARGRSAGGGFVAGAGGAGGARSDTRAAAADAGGAAGAGGAARSDARGSAADAGGAAGAGGGARSS